VGIPRGTVSRTSPASPVWSHWADTPRSTRRRRDQTALSASTQW
jgi:hypothetical protein